VAVGWKVKTTGLSGRFIGQIVGVLVVVMLLTSPMWLRNLSLYGDPLARTIYKATGPNFSPADIEKVAGWTHADYLRQVGVRSVASFWYFIHPNTPLSRFVGEPVPFAAIAAVIAPALVGCMKLLRDPVIILPFYFVFVSQVFQAQGRYFLPALLPIAVITIAGWTRLSPRAGIAFVPSAILGLLFIKQLLGGGFASQ
jgi:hypothetical protein